MQIFISCDWGTSALRLRVVNKTDISVLGETLSAEGVFATFELWKKNAQVLKDRFTFFQSVLAEQIKKLETELELPLKDIPIVISGMASSSIGMMELPYKEIPFSIDGHDLNVQLLEATEEFNHPMLIISGVKTDDDAMRGEETQLIGCFDNDDKEEHFFIFPGTHSKHVWVKNGKAINVKTYLTGEFFELLSKKSVLSNDVEYTQDLLSESNLKSFDDGVLYSLHTDILHGSFIIRTNHLFGKLSKQENYCFLSGLVIGTELKELKNLQVRLELVGGKHLVKLYHRALQKLGISSVKLHDVSDAIIKAHIKIYECHKSELIMKHQFIKQ